MAGREVDEQQIDRTPLDQGTGHREAFVEGFGREDDEPFEPNTPGDGLDGIEAGADVEPGDDRSAGLCLCDEPERERGLAARMIAAQRNTRVARNSTRAEDGIERGKTGRHHLPDIRFCQTRRAVRSCGMRRRTDGLVERTWLRLRLVGPDRGDEPRCRDGHLRAR